MTRTAIHLFDPSPALHSFAPDAVLLTGFALAQEKQLLADFHRILEAAPPQQMLTAGGLKMSAAMTNCGDLGWVSDRKGYRYSRHDFRQQKWPHMPDSFFRLATEAATTAGFPAFIPDACLINIYRIGSKMGLHQDRDEHDFSRPIVSVSLGIPATFLFSGAKRTDKTIKIPLLHGDVVVWGGASRLFYHGIAPIKAGKHPILGEIRCNLTFRKAG